MEYLNCLSFILKEIEEKEKANIDNAVNICTKAIFNKGLVHIFGSGHSVLPVMDAFPRYGSYVGLNPVMDPRLMWFNVVGSGGAHELIWLERQVGYIENFLMWQDLKKEDVMIIFSHGGINAAPVEAAMFAKKNGLQVIGITCMEHQKQAKNLHSSRKKLSDIADIVIDTHTPISDAVVKLKHTEQKVSATSTVAAIAIMQTLVGEIAISLENLGYKLDIFKSPNIGGTLESNSKVFFNYKDYFKKRN